MRIKSISQRASKILVCCILIGSVISACSASQATPSSTATPTPTTTATPEPLGWKGNPIVLGVVYQNIDVQAPAAEDLIESLQKSTGYNYQLAEFSDYKALVEAMRKKIVHLAWLPPLTYLYAHQINAADVAFLTNHLGVYSYGTQFMANKSSRLVSYFDEKTGKNTADAYTALLQLADLRPCFTDSKSLAGYIVPLGYLKQNDLPTKDPALLQSPAAVVRALYIRGICDFGATYATTGDPRTSSAVQQDLPDASQQITILWQSDPVIPNLNMSFHPSVPSDIRAAVMVAIGDLSQKPEGLNTLSTMANYEIHGLKTVDTTFYDPLSSLVTEADVDLKSLIGW